MATVTHVFTIDYVAELLEEDVELLRAITYGHLFPNNDDGEELAEAERAFLA